MGAACFDGDVENVEAGRVRGRRWIWKGRMGTSQPPSSLVWASSTHPWNWRELKGLGVRWRVGVKYPMGVCLSKGNIKLR